MASPATIPDQRRTRESPVTRRPRLVSSQALAGAVILEQTAEYLSRYVKFPYPGQSEIVALLAARDHAFSASESQLYPLIASALHASGTTRLTMVASYLLPTGARRYIATTAAPVYETINEHHPSVMFESIHMVMAPGSDNRRVMRDLLDGASERGVILARMRTVDGTQTVKEFDVYTPIWLSGRLTGIEPALMSRCLVIWLEREQTDYLWTSAEKRKAQRDGAKLRAEITAWMQANLPALGAAVPEIPETLRYKQGGRIAEGLCLPLAIADLAGGKWPELARQTFTNLIQARESDGDDITVHLLRNMRKIFGDKERMSTQEILISLIELDGEPWHDMWSADIWNHNGTPRRAEMALSRMLKPFDITPAKIRVSASVTRQGFTQSDFTSVWRRYL